jgi:hypothetical protein
MKKIPYLFILVMVVFSCKKNLPVASPAPISAPNGDTIQISNYLQKQYTFSNQNLIYLGPDEQIILDTLPIATPFFVDISHTYIEYKNQIYLVGKYQKHDSWRKGYIRLANIANQWLIHPNDSNNIFLLGLEEVDTTENYTCELRFCQKNRLISHFNFGENYYISEFWTKFNFLDSLCTRSVLVMNVNFEFLACGSSGDNYLFVYDGQLKQIMNYHWSAYELMDYEEIIYATLPNTNQLLEMQDGKFTGNTLNDSLPVYPDDGPIWIKRIKTSDWYGKLEENKPWKIKETIQYDLVYSFELNQLVMLDSIAYDSTKCRIYTADWVN